MTLQHSSQALALMFVSAVCGAVGDPEQQSGTSTTYTAELVVGGEYDSNVTIDEVDLNSSQSDYGLTLEAKLGARTQLSKNTVLDLSYDYSQISYREFSLVDRKTHILGSNLEVGLGEFDAGISYFYISSRLNNSKFLEFSRVSPSLSGFLAKKWFARGAYVYTDKTIENSRGRNAQSNAGEVDIYYFRRGLRSYFNVGYQYKNEDARDAQYDYKSGNIKIRYIQRFELLSKIATLQLAFRYEDRNYSSDTPSIEKNRADKRERWRVDLKIPVIDKGAIQMYAGYSDYESNLPRADYTQNVVGTKFSYRW